MTKEQATREIQWRREDIAFADDQLAKFTEIAKKHCCKKHNNDFRFHTYCDTCREIKEVMDGFNAQKIRERERIKAILRGEA